MMDDLESFELLTHNVDSIDELILIPQPLEFRIRTHPPDLDHDLADHALVLSHHRGDLCLKGDAPLHLVG